MLKRTERGGWPAPTAAVFYAENGGTPHPDRRHVISLWSIGDEDSAGRCLTFEDWVNVEVSSDKPSEDAVIETVEVVD